MPKYYNLVRGRNIYNRILQSIETANGITFATMNLCKENKSLEPTKAIKEKLNVEHTEGNYKLTVKNGLQYWDKLEGDWTKLETDIIEDLKKIVQES